jgi:hypothetical protein
MPLLNRVLYWLSSALTLACVALVLASNTPLIWRFEHIGIPLSWIAGALAIVAFVAFEYLDSTSPVKAPAPAYLAFMGHIDQEPELS